MAAGQAPLFQSHMWDGSAVPLDENLRVAVELQPQYRRAHAIMELEIGVVGGEEDGVTGEAGAKLYSAPSDALQVAERLGLGEPGPLPSCGHLRQCSRRLPARSRPAPAGILREIQDAVGARYGRQRPFDLVFHGGSGSSLAEIHEAVSCGVMKMNVDTDAQPGHPRSHVGPTTTACSRSTAVSVRNRHTIPGPMDAPPRLPCRRASPRPAATWALPAATSEGSE